MIVFDLICRERHRFEGWFASGEEFLSQQDRGLLECPVCGEAHVEKLPAAKIRKQLAEPATSVVRADKPKLPVSEEDFARVLDYILTHTEDVGSDFAAEARKIYYEETAQRSIRGVVTRLEAQELDDEGVPVFTLPIPPQDKWN